MRKLIEDWLKKLEQIDDTQAAERVASRWNRKQVLGHLIDSACNNHQRFVRLQAGDLGGFPPYDPDQWVEAGCYGAANWADLVRLWHAYNLQLALLIDNVDAAALKHVWKEKNATLGFLIDDYQSHMLHHLRQLEA